MRVRQVRLIAGDGTQVGIVSIEEALEKAREASLDLVEVAPQSDPPVCRLMNYGRYLYEQKRKKGEPKKHRVSKLKELRLHPKTERHDIDVRIRQARKFLERGDRVLVNMIFRGREKAHVDIGKKVLDDFAAQLADIARIEKPPVLEDRRMGMLLVHQKGEHKRPADKPAEAKPQGEAPVPAPQQEGQQQCPS